MNRINVSVELMKCLIHSFADQQQDLSVQDADYKSFASYACQKMLWMCQRLNSNQFTVNASEFTAY